MRTLVLSDYTTDNRVPVKIVYTNQGNSHYPLHKHDFHELVIVKQGSGQHCFNDVKLNISVGDVFLILPGQTHSYLRNNSLKLINVLFNLSELKLPLKEFMSLRGYHILFQLEPFYRNQCKTLTGLRLNPKELKDVERQITTINDEASAKREGYLIATKALMQNFLVTICRTDNRDQDCSCHYIYNLAGVVSYLEAHFKTDISINDMLGLAHMSRTNFFRTFKEIYQITPLEYLLQIRLQEAAYLLRNSNMSVTHIALEVGLTDGNYLARCFKRMYGYTPSYYKKHFSESRI